jgi:hypothetical protein
LGGLANFIINTTYKWRLQNEVGDLTQAKRDIRKSFNKFEDPS